MKYIKDRPMAQGDLLIIPVENLPDNLKAATPIGDQFVVAHSETGHHHVIDCHRDKVGNALVTAFEAADDSFCAYIKTLGEPAEVKHLRNFHTHESIMLEPNKVYQIKRQREYTPQGWRRAQD